MLTLCDAIPVFVRLDTLGLDDSLTRLIHYSLPSEAFTTLAANTHMTRGNEYKSARNLSPALCSAVIYVV